MSDNFFESLGIPEPDINLGIGSGSHAEQVGYTMMELEKVLIERKPDWVVVVGDVNATLAASVTAKKLWIKVAHIEAGLRSGDMTMPEEINRLVTDRLSDLLLVPDRLSAENLRNEGTAENKIVFVGNIMIDTMEANRIKAEGLSIERIIEKNLIQNNKSNQPAGSQNFTSFAVMTLHRPSNVDDKSIFLPILDFLIEEVASKMPLIWPIHPRTRKQMESFGIWDKILSQSNLILLYPIDYLEMLRLNMSATTMLTDSGGLQEECTILGTPCLTIRWNTERPITLIEHKGAGILVGNSIENIRKGYATALAMGRQPHRPELWDGQTAKRCLQAILNY
jgi:UDP-N-acetylglucosamine 2-epimerase (non-hydrolysing)